MERHTILLVDDEELLLELYTMQLSGEFDILTAQSAARALEELSTNPQIALVIADMHMPEMNGIEFLHCVQQTAPHAVRIMLTSDTEQDVAVEAVNRSAVFRFLKKPCSSEQLAAAIRAGAEYYKLRTAERDMLASTVSGSVALMGELLALVSPLAFGKASRVARTIDELCRRLDVEDAWELGMAATLSQLGCITLPDALIRQAAARGAMAAADAAVWQSHPQLGHDLISRIPRLERVADIVLLQHAVYRPSMKDEAGERNTVAWRAACLRTALDYDTRIEQQAPPHTALQGLTSVPAAYPPDVLSALNGLIRDAGQRGTLGVTLDELRPGMILEENIVDTTGRILLTKGQQIADWLITRLQRMSDTRDIQQPIHVTDPNVRLDLPPIGRVESVPRGVLGGTLVGAI